MVVLDQGLLRNSNLLKKYGEGREGLKGERRTGGDAAIL